MEIVNSKISGVSVFNYTITKLPDYEITKRESRMPTVIKKLDAGSYQLKDQVVAINRVTKVVKGGKNLSFAALVVVGDPSAAVVGYGSGRPKKFPRPFARESSRRRKI